jgi:hypothetical protein
MKKNNEKEFNFVDGDVSGSVMFGAAAQVIYCRVRNYAGD